MKSIILFLSYSLLSVFITPEAPTQTAEIEHLVTIKMASNEELNFDFSIEYVDWREQIHIRSAEPIRALALSVDNQKRKPYNIIGSELVILPLTDFNLDTKHLLDISFINSDKVIQAEITVATLDN